MIDARMRATRVVAKKFFSAVHQRLRSMCDSVSPCFANGNSIASENALANAEVMHYCTSSTSVACALHWRNDLHRKLFEGVEMSTRDLEGTWWFCLDHHVAETFDSCTSTNRIGPWNTREEAANALNTIAERERRYDEEDATWEGGR